MHLLEVLFNLIDPRLRTACDGKTLRGDLDPGEFINLALTLEIGRYVDHVVDLLQHRPGEFEEVSLLPLSPPFDRKLIGAKSSDGVKSGLLEFRWEGRQIHSLEAVSVDDTLQPDHGHEAGAKLRSFLREATMVEQQPDGEHGIEVRVVGVDHPSFVLEVEAFENDDDGLLARGEGEGTNASLVVIEVVDALRGIDKGLPLGHAVEKNRAPGIFAGCRSRNAEASLYPHRDIRRLGAGKETPFVILLDVVTQREVLSGHWWHDDRLGDRRIRFGG